MDGVVLRFKPRELAAFERYHFTRFISFPYRQTMDREGSFFVAITIVVYHERGLYINRPRCIYPERCRGDKVRLFKSQGGMLYKFPCTFGRAAERTTRQNFCNLHTHAIGILKFTVFHDVSFGHCRPFVHPAFRRGGGGWWWCNLLQVTPVGGAMLLQVFFDFVDGLTVNRELSGGHVIPF